MTENKIKNGYFEKDFEEKAFSSEITCSIAGRAVNEWITEYTFTVTNNGARAVEIIPFVEISTEERVEFYSIPCVNYNGNEWGNGKEPKGMEVDGKPWIFPSDRVGLPGCSIVEGEDYCSALFADGKGVSSNASTSVFMRGDETVQRLYFSYVEYPKVYLCKFVYGEPIVEYVPFIARESKVFTFYIYNYQKHNEGKYYGYKRLFDYINGGEYYSPIPAKYDVQTIKDWSFAFFTSLTEKYGDGYLSNMGMLPGGEHRLGDENSKYIYRTFGKYEIGWCGQNITAAEMYLRAYKETGNEEYKAKGLGILNNWKKRIYPSGLISGNYDVPFDGSERIDSCNEGWLLYKLIYCIRLLKELDIPSAPYEEMAKTICNFYLKNYPTGGFPQILNSDGSVYVADGCAGVMIMLGLLESYTFFCDKGHLLRAISAFDFYYITYLERSVAAGGALDTYCIDKESAGPVLRSALLLYKITSDKKYLDCAENIAHYLMTWAFYHDVKFNDQDDCAVFNVRTTGGTSVSAAHHHIDCWGLFYVPDMHELYKLTKNVGYFNHARALWTFTVQYISDGNMKLHGMVRPLGAQNEAILQCNWHGGDEKRGQLNDWMVAWVKSFQLDVIYALRDEGFFEGI